MPDTGLCPVSGRLESSVQVRVVIERRSIPKVKASKAVAAPICDRREVLLSALGLAALFSACRSSGEPRTESLQEIQDAVRSQLIALAEGPEETERLLSIFADLESASKELVDSHIDFVTEADRLTRDRSVSSEEIQGLLEANVEGRRQTAERLLIQQNRIKTSLGPGRWGRLVTDLNDPERMERILGRKG
jgi:septal ring factor EnvC (AmiA/AmiB activator)